jgi:hypothetical protein
MAAGSSDEPSSFVNIELYQTIVSHLQQKVLARLLVRDIGAFHDFVDFEWLLAERAQNSLSLIQHDQTQTAADGPSARAQLPGAAFLRRKDTGPKIPARRTGAGRDHPVTEPVSTRAGNGNF